MIFSRISLERDPVREFNNVSTLPHLRFDLRHRWFLSEDFFGNRLDFGIGDFEQVLAGLLR